MSARLILATFSTLLEETAIVVIVRWALPQVGINIRLPSLIVIMVIWGAFSVFTYHLGSRALRRKQVIGLPDMVGTKGTVVNPLAPEGLIRARGELWIAKSTSGEMETGEEVVVVEQERLKLVVRPSGSISDLEMTE